MGSENSKQNSFSPLWLKPTDRSGFSRSFEQQRKNVLFAHGTSPLPRVLASQDTGHRQTLRACAPLSWVLAAMFEGRRWSVSRCRLGRGLTQFCINFLRFRREGHFRSEKKSGRNGSGSHDPSETSRHTPPTALKRGRRLVAAVTCYMWKSRFFLCRWTEMTHHCRRHCSRVSVVDEG